jgi:NAD+ synthase
MPVMNAEGLYEDRIAAIRGMGVDRAAVGVSGGIDSLIIAALSVGALGPENVTLVFTGIDSSEDSHRRAVEVAKGLGCPLIDYDATAVFDLLVAGMLEAIETSAPQGPWYGGPGLKDPGQRLMEQVRERIAADPTVLGSIRSCIRAPILRGFNRMMGNGIVHGTGNECEDRLVRFYQKGGDGEVDTNPIAMLSKGEVYQLALYIGKVFGFEDITREIVEAKPTPDLWANGEEHNDEDEYNDYIGVTLPDGWTWYSYVDVKTGEYTHVGVLERVARFLDTDEISPGPVEDVLLHFADGEFTPTIRDQLVRKARPFFGYDIQYSTIIDILMALRRIEAGTRHKMNPNCPALGCRSDLVVKGLLSNELPL